MQRLFFVLGFFFLISIGQAQEKEFFTGIFPEISLSKKLSDKHRLNFKTEHQSILYERNSLKSNPQITHYRTDIMGFFDRSIKPGFNLALGVFHRFQDQGGANRIIQQANFLTRGRGVRVNHRFRTDQTFTKNMPFTFRFRYRLTLEIPLEGMELDPGESYLLMQGESILGLNSIESDIENRLAFSFGRYWSKKEKFEMGIDYRTDGYLTNGFRTRLWPKVSYYYNF